MTQWKDTVAKTLMLERPESIEEGSISIAMTFYVYPPQSISKIKTKRPVPNEVLETMYVNKRPDIDNYVKAILDSSNGILFKDDGQIAALSAQKLYSMDPRIEIDIQKLEVDLFTI